MSLITVAAGQPIRATHVNQFTQWITGVRADISPTFISSSASLYTLSVTNQDMSAGLIAQFTYGATTVMTVNKTGVTINALTILQTQADMISASAANTPVRIPKGTAYQELTMNSGATGQTWASGILALAATAGDLFYATGLNAVSRLPKSADGLFLTLGSGLPTWGTPATAAQTIQSPIINGGFNVPQRGTSFASVASSDYTLDRWQYFKTLGTGVHDVSQSTDVPSVATTVALQISSMYFQCKTTEAAVTSSEFCFAAQAIEGFQWLPFAQRPFTLSFWVKATKTGTYCVSFRNSGQDRSYVAEYSVASSATWEQKTVAVPSSPSAGTWNYTTGVGLRVGWALAAGATFQATAGAWTTGSFLASSNQVNGLDSTADDFRLAMVQIDLGTSASAFAPRPFALEYSMAQRYCQKSYDFAAALGAATGAGYIWGQYSDNNTSKTVAIPVRYSTVMRSSPTVTLYDMAGTASKVSTVNASLTVTDGVTPSVGVFGAGAAGMNVVHTGTVAGLEFHYLATAEL